MRVTILSEKAIHEAEELSLTGKVTYCKEVSICKAQAELTTKEIVEWGNEPCVEHSKVEFPAEIGGGIVERQKVKRRRCQHCWEALKGS